MRIPRRLILSVYRDLASKQESVTQFDVHLEISRRLGRRLEIGEKIRITRVLLEELGVKGERQEGSYRILLF